MLVLNSKSQFSASKQDFTVVTETYLEKVPVKKSAQQQVNFTCRCYLRHFINFNIVCLLAATQICSVSTFSANNRSLS